MTPDIAMVYAAGFGKRMMPLTASMPKPMIEVLGKPLLGHALDKVASAGIGRAIVNTHYKPETVLAYLKTRKEPKIEISHETEILETGGGAKKVIGLLGEKP